MDLNSLNLERASFSGLIWQEGKFRPGLRYIEGSSFKEGTRGKVVEVPYLLPAWADLHIHGGWGASFQQAEFAFLESKLKSIGVLLAIPTLANDSLVHTQKIAAEFRRYRSQQQHSIFPFLRQEGPFISSGKKGAQEANYIQAITPEAVDAFLSLDGVQLFTFAPELEGADRLVKETLARGKIPSVGHSQATFQDFKRVYELGVRHVTHFPNAVRSFHHRELGVVGAGLFFDDLQLEVIGDGIHTSFEFLELLLKFKGPSFALVSDMIPPAYCSLQEELTSDYVVRGREMRDATGMLVGGGTSVPEQVVRLRKRGWPVEVLVKIAAEKPRQFLGLNVNQLQEGEEATFLICGKNLEVWAVFEAGNCLYLANELKKRLLL